jgi:aminobenzoyl-glutamate utilization protein B
MYDNLVSVGGVNYTNEEKVFANKIALSLGQKKVNLETAMNIQPYKTVGKAYGSTDVGDVSFTVPTVGMGSATWIPGTPAHSWQAVAAGGTSIGEKGMIVAAKTIALTGMQLIDSPKVIKAAQENFIQKRGADFKYTPMLGDRKPALNYRN